QPLLAVEDPALDSPQRLELLAQRFLALVALLVRGLALSLHGRPLLVEAIDLPRDALTLGHLGRQECRVAAGGRPGGIDDRFEKLGRARIVAQRRRQAGKERREAQAVEGARVARESLLGRGERDLLVRCRRSSELRRFADDAVDLVASWLQQGL